jgi:hypothetical protein
VQKASTHESPFQTSKSKYQVVQMQNYSSDSDENEVGLAEWTKLSGVHGSRKKPGERYDFDVIKCDKIFDLLLQEKHISLPPNHMLPSPEELKRKKWCKCNNSPLHHTNECGVFNQRIQMSIEQWRINFLKKKQWRIKFDDQKRPMKIDGHPFPMNMIGGSAAPCSHQEV